MSLAWSQAPALPEGWETFGKATGIPAGAECGVLVESGQPKARLAWGLLGTAAPQPRPLAYAGWFACADAQSGAGLLAEAAERAKAQGCAEIIGPLNSSTWQDYRLVTSGTQEPAFGGEPRPGPHDAAAFTLAGFRAREHYESRVVELGQGRKWREEIPARIWKRWDPAIRGLNLADWEGDLGLLHEEATESFEDNVLYSPISRAGFLAYFSALRPLFDPALVRLAFDREGRLVGHVLSWVEGDRLILKNLACKKAQRGLGLAHALAALVLDEAEARGLKKAVYALMHVKNQSDRMAEAYGRAFRGYALFGRAL